MLCRDENFYKRSHGSAPIATLENINSSCHDIRLAIVAISFQRPPHMRWQVCTSLHIHSYIYVDRAAEMKDKLFSVALTFHKDSIDTNCIFWGSNSLERLAVSNEQCCATIQEKEYKFRTLHPRSWDALAAIGSVWLEMYVHSQKE